MDGFSDAASALRWKICTMLDHRKFNVFLLNRQQTDSASIRRTSNRYLIRWQYTHNVHILQYLRDRQLLSKSIKFAPISRLLAIRPNSTQQPTTCLPPATHNSQCLPPTGKNTSSTSSSLAPPEPQFPQHRHPNHALHRPATGGPTPHTTVCKHRAQAVQQNPVASRLRRGEQTWSFESHYFRWRSSKYSAVHSHDAIWHLLVYALRCGLQV
jgi:hypothetical protein